MITKYNDTSISYSINYPTASLKSDDDTENWLLWQLLMLKSKFYVFLKTQPSKKPVYTITRVDKNIEEQQ